MTGLLITGDSAAGLIALALLLAGYGATAACAARGLSRAGQPVRLADLAFLPAYWILHGLAAWRAAGELAHRPFHWEKTEHGRSRLADPPDARFGRPGPSAY